ncbi:MAG: hypothetical protein HWN68_16230 [Desulfobacterales bacterium]|nr:hypothetical protein [Desulfobacterales bacterium]
MASHDYAFVSVDGCVEWVEFPRDMRRVKAMELVERWIRGEVEALYLGRRFTE